MRNEEILDVAYTGARRRMIIWVLALENGPIHLNTLAERIGGVSVDTGDRAKFHNSMERRILTRDIKAINLSEDYPHTYIRTGSAGVERCLPSEIAEAAEKKKKAVLRQLWELKVLQKKAGNNDNLRLEELIHA